MLNHFFIGSLGVSVHLSDPLNISGIALTDYEHGGDKITEVGPDNKAQPAAQPTKEKAVVVKGWALLHVLQHTHSQTKPETYDAILPLCLAHAIADTMGVCRSAVTISNTKGSTKSPDDTYDMAYHGTGQTVLVLYARHVLTAMKRLMRASSFRSQGREASTRPRWNMTKLRVVFEVRPFTEMEVVDYEVARRIDRLQLYSKFYELNRLFTREVSREGVSDVAAVVVDDLGYASRHVLDRPIVTDDARANCTAEMHLHAAEAFHEYVVAVSLLLVGLISCTGSTVFALKLPSHVPSAFNPIIDTDT